MNLHLMIEEFQGSLGVKICIERLRVLVKEKYDEMVRISSLENSSSTIPSLPGNITQGSKEQGISCI